MATHRSKSRIEGIDTVTWQRFEQFVFHIEKHLKQKEGVNAVVTLDDRKVWDYATESIYILELKFRNGQTKTSRVVVSR